MDGAMVWKGSKSLFPAMGTWCILTHKRKHPSLVLSADTSQQGILLSQRKSLSIRMGPVYERYNCFHLAYLKMRYNKEVNVLRATDWLDSSHSQKLPHIPLYCFLRHKTISQGHGNNDTEIQSIEIKHMKLTLIKAKLCHLSEGSSLLFKTIQQSLITAIVYCSKGIQKAKEYQEDLLYYSARFNYMVFSSVSRCLQFTTCLHQRT